MNVSNLKKDGVTFGFKIKFYVMQDTKATDAWLDQVRGSLQLADICTREWFGRDKRPDLPPCEFGRILPNLAEPHCFEVVVQGGERLIPFAEVPTYLLYLKRLSDELGTKGSALDCIGGVRMVRLNPFIGDNKVIQRAVGVL